MYNYYTYEKQKQELENDILEQEKFYKDKKRHRNLTLKLAKNYDNRIKKFILELIRSPIKIRDFDKELRKATSNEKKGLSFGTFLTEKERIKKYLEDKKFEENYYKSKITNSKRKYKENMNRTDINFGKNLSNFQNMNNTQKIDFHPEIKKNYYNNFNLLNIKKNNNDKKEKNALDSKNNKSNLKNFKLFNNEFESLVSQKIEKNIEKYNSFKKEFNSILKSKLANDPNYKSKSTYNLNNKNNNRNLSQKIIQNKYNFVQNSSTDTYIDDDEDSESNIQVNVKLRKRRQGLVDLKSKQSVDKNNNDSTVNLLKKLKINFSDKTPKKQPPEHTKVMQDLMKEYNKKTHFKGAKQYADKISMQFNKYYSKSMTNFYNKNKSNNTNNFNNNNLNKNSSTSNFINLKKKINFHKNLRDQLSSDLDNKDIITKEVQFQVSNSLISNLINKYPIKYENFDVVGSIPLIYNLDKKINDIGISKEYENQNSINKELQEKKLKYLQSFMNIDPFTVKPDGDNFYERVRKIIQENNIFNDKRNSLFSDSNPKNCYMQSKNYNSSSQKSANIKSNSFSRSNSKSNDKSSNNSKSSRSSSKDTFIEIPAYKPANVPPNKAIKKITVGKQEIPINRMDIIANKVLKKCKYISSKNKSCNSKLKKGEGKLMCTSGLSINDFEKKYKFK